jgi:hypothetical protein
LIVGKVIIHEQPVDLSLERMKRHLALSPQERLYALVNLCKLSMKMSGRKTIGTPQGKGLVIRKQINQVNQKAQ